MSFTPGFVHELVRPPGPASRVLLLLHGTGGDEHQLLSLGRQLDASAILLSPRGRVKEGNANRFFRRHAEGVFDMPNLIAETADLARFIDATRAEYQLNDLPFIAVGYSNGANIALSLLLRHPKVLSGAVLFRAMPQQPPQSLPDLSGVKVFVGAGKFDPFMPPPLTAELNQLLTNTRATTTTSTQPAGHELTHGDIHDAARWLAGISD